MTNWKTDLPILGSHTSDGYGWKRDTNGDIVEEPCNVTYIPPPTGSAIESMPYNGTGESRSAHHHAQANVTIRWEWKGAGPAPTKVWVRKFASASGSVSPNGSTSVNNGLGSPISEYNGSPYTFRGKHQTGSKLQEVSLSGNFLEVSFSLEASATSSNSTAPYNNTAFATLSYGISLKTSFIGFGTTYYKEDGSWNRLPVGAGYTATVVHSDPPSTTPRYDYNGNQLGWYAELLMLSIKIGTWVDPYHKWEAEGQTWTDSLFVERNSQSILFNLSSSSIETLPDSNGIQREVRLETSDINNLEDPTVIPSTHTVVLFAPIMHAKVFAIDVTPTYVHASNFQVATPGYAVDGGSIACTWHEFTGIWDVFNRIQQGADLAAQFASIPWLKATIKALGFAMDDLEPKPNNGTCNWIWGNDECTYDGLLEPPFGIPSPGNWTTTFENWKMTPVLKLKYRGHDVEGEAWGIDGYQNRTTSRGKKHEGFKWVGMFTTINGGSSGGGSGGSGAGE